MQSLETCSFARGVDDQHPGNIVVTDSPTSKGFVIRHSIGQNHIWIRSISQSDKGPVIVCNAYDLNAPNLAAPVVRVYGAALYLHKKLKGWSSTLWDARPG